MTLFPQKIMIIAGEASGDQHGAKVVRALRTRNPHLAFYGIGGRNLAAEGVHILVEASTLSVVGITEVFSKLGNIVHGLKTAKKFLRKERPELLILIDFPDFNLMVAKTAKQLGIPVLYYISPQIWAWRSSRVKKIGNRVDHMAVIFPFEAQFYRKHGIPVTFVGHPLLDSSNLPVFRMRTGLSSPPVIGLLPGSRDREVTTLLPAMIQASEIISNHMKNVRFVVSVAPSVERDSIERIIDAHQPSGFFELVTDNVNAVLEKSDIVIAASGTVTLEAAISGVPMIIVYKVSPTSYRLGKALIRVDYICLVNLISKKQVVPELIQHDASPANIAHIALSMLNDDGRLQRISDELCGVRRILGGKGASVKVANIALDMLKAAKGAHPDG